jgi:hypothetical protein
MIRLGKKIAKKENGDPKGRLGFFLGTFVKNDVWKSRSRTASISGGRPDAKISLGSLPDGLGGKGIETRRWSGNPSPIRIHFLVANGPPLGPPIRLAWRLKSASGLVFILGYLVQAAAIFAVRFLVSLSAQLKRPVTSMKNQLSEWKRRGLPGSWKTLMCSCRVLQPRRDHCILP